jgi:hypothetical protein
MRSHSVFALALPLLLLAMGGTGWAAGATKPGRVPRSQFASWKRTGEVTDLANVLDDAVEEKLRNQAREVRAKSGVDLAVATLPGLPSGEWDKDLAVLARRWEVGGRTKGLGNTGLLLVIMPFGEPSGWVLLWGYAGEGSGVVFKTERGAQPRFEGTSTREPPVERLTREFRVLAHLYAAYYGFALEPSGPRPASVASTATERTARIDDPVKVLDAQARAQLQVTLDDVRRHTGAEWFVTTTGAAADAQRVDPQKFVEALGLTARFRDRRSGDLLAVVRTSDGSGDFTAGRALQAALDAEPSAFSRVPPLRERERAKAQPFRSLDLSLRDFARRYAAQGGWALSPRWTENSGLPPLRPDASIQWTPVAATHTPPAVPPQQGTQADAERMRLPGAYTTGGQPLWSSGGVVSSPSEAALVRSLPGAYSPLMGLLWLWLTLRALVVDRRGAWVRLLVVCILGAPCAVGVLAFTATGVFAYMNDRMPDSLAALTGFLVAGVLGFLFVEGVANPTFKDRHGHLRSYIAAGKPSLSLRWQRPGLTLCRWGLGGVGLGFIALGLAVGFAKNAMVAYGSGRLQPMHVALGLAIALAVVGVIKASAMVSRAP